LIHQMEATLFRWMGAIIHRAYANVSQMDRVRGLSRRTESHRMASAVTTPSPRVLLDFLHVLSTDELMHAGHDEGQYATFGRVDQALFDELVAGDRQVTGPRFTHTGCQSGHRRCLVAGEVGKCGLYQAV
jgi:hypothetical protein